MLQILTSRSKLSLANTCITVFLLVAVLIATDPLIGWVGTRIFPEPPAIMHDPNSLYGLDLFWKSSREGHHPVVFTGSSMMMEALDPSIFESVIKQEIDEDIYSLNTGMVAQTSMLSRDIIKHVFIPRGASAVIYGIEPRAFAERYYVDEINKSALGKTLQMPEGVEKQAKLWLLENSNWVRYHNNIHDLLTGNHYILQLGKPFSRTVNERAHKAVKSNPDTRAVYAPNDMTPLLIQSPYQQALEEIAQTCQQTKTPCAIINMPLNPTLQEVISEKEYIDYRKMIADSLRDTGVLLWDFGALDCNAYFDGQFHDFSHLNTIGAERFTQLAAALYMREMLNKAVELPTDCVASSSSLQN